MSQKVIVENQFFALLPNGVYTKANKSNVLSQIEGFSSIEQPNYFEEEVVEDLILLWATESTSVNTLKQKYSPKLLTHIIAEQIRHIISAKKNGLYLFKDALKVTLIFVKEGELQLVNSFDFNEKEDALYFALLLKDKYGELPHISLLGGFSDKECAFIKKYCPNALRETKWKGAITSDFEEGQLRAFIS